MNKKTHVYRNEALLVAFSYEPGRHIFEFQEMTPFSQDMIANMVAKRVKITVEFEVDE